MANQYTVNIYSIDEINKVLSLYESGVSYTMISRKLHRKKNNIKKLLIEQGVYIKNRDVVKKKFSKEDINEIIFLYVNDNKSTREIAKIFKISLTPIKYVLKEQNLLRKGYSDGKKIILSEEQKDKIRISYLFENKNCKEIGNELNLSAAFISSFLSKNNKLRSRGEATTLYKTGKSPSKEAIENMKRGQRKLALSGKRKQTGGVCKTFVIDGLKCQGMCEKTYIDLLIENRNELPQNAKSINTPFDAYYPDFKFNDKFIEIKSTYTYDVLLGIKKSRWTNQYETKQYKKIKWVNENILPVEITIIDKNKIKEIKIL